VAPRLKLATGSCLAVLAGLVVMFVAFSGSTASPAFAGWSATPTAASTAQIAATLRACHSRVPLAIADTRGPYTAAIFGGRLGGVACLVGPSSSAAGGIAGLTTSGKPVAPDQVQTSALTGSDAQGHGFVLLAGRAGSRVTGVTIHRSHGGDVVASVKHGWYLVWWPADIRAINATVTSTHDSHMIDLPSAATQGSSSCGAGCASFGGSGGGAALGGPPLIQGPVAKPFHSILLFVVSNARRVQLCLHPGPAPASGPPVTPSMTNCIQARLLTKLPRSYPVQRNLLTLFQDSVWMIKLPRRIESRHSLHADVTVFGYRGWGSSSGGFGASW
jgi:hypothetical protein